MSFKLIDMFKHKATDKTPNFPLDKIFNTFDNYWNSFEEIIKNYSENDKKLLFSSNAEKFYRI